MSQVLCDFLLARLQQVERDLGVEPQATDSGVRFADAIDSMGFAEFLATVADACGVSVETITRAAGPQFGSVAELAEVLHRAGLQLQGVASPRLERGSSANQVRPTLGWLTGAHAVLPCQAEPAASLDARLGKPAG